MRKFIFPLLAVLAGTMVGCESSNSPAQISAMQDESRAALDRMVAQDPSLSEFVNNAYGYVVFPEIGEGAIGIGGASGKGIVYRGGQRMGIVNMTQGSIGIQLGGQTFAELIVFQDDKAFNRLMNDSFEFGADAKATAVKAGAAATKEFANGARVFTLTKGGLMAGVSLTGQKFHFQPNSDSISSSDSAKQ